MTVTSGGSKRRFRAVYLLLLLSLVPPALVLIFIANFRLAVPYGDEWRQDAPIAIDAAAGRLTPAELFVFDDGHRQGATNIFVALIATYLHWSLKLETLINFAVIVGQMILLILFFRQSTHGKSLWLVALALFSLMVFNLTRQESWLSFRHSHFSFSALFILLALFLISQGPRARWKLVAALGCAVCASFSSSSGLLAWPLMLISFWFRNALTRRRAFILIALAVVVGVLYFANTSIGIGKDVQDDETNPLANTSADLEIKDPATWLTDTGILLSAAFFDEDRDHTLVLLVTVLAMIIGAINLFYLRRTEGSWGNMASWLVIAGYGLGTSLLISLARSSDDASFASQYKSVAAFVWIAFVALSLMSLAHTVRDRQIWRVSLTALNVAALAAVVVLFMQGNVLGLSETETYWGRQMTLIPPTTLKPVEQCVLDYRFTRDETCLDLVEIRRYNFDAIDKFAAYRLAIFSGQSPTLILPGDYRPEDTVIVSTDDAWTNLHIRDWLLAGVPDDHLLTVLPEDEVSDSFSLDTPRPLRNIMASDGATLPENDGVIWFIYETDIEASRLSDIERPLTDAGFVISTTDTVPAPFNLVVTSFRHTS